MAKWMTENLGDDLIPGILVPATAHPKKPYDHGRATINNCTFLLVDPAGKGPHS